MSEVTLLRAKWEELKEKDPYINCNHPEFTAQTFLGNDTLEYACTTCGELFYKYEMDEFLKLRKRIK